MSREDLNRMAREAIPVNGNGGGNISIDCQDILPSGDGKKVCPHLPPTVVPVGKGKMLRLMFSCIEQCKHYGENGECKLETK